MFKQFITNRTINKKPVVVCHAPALGLWFRWLLLLRKAWPQSGINQLSVLPFISLSSHWREGMGLRVLASDEKLPSSPWHLNKPWPSPTQHPLRLPKYAFAFIIREKQIATAKPGTIIYLANFFFSDLTEQDILFVPALIDVLAVFWLRRNSIRLLWK